MLQRLPGGICFSHGPYKDTVGCPEWPACITDPQNPEYVALAESQKPTPHVYPPLSAALREKIQKRIEWQDAKRLAPPGNVANTQRLYAYVDALRWLLREADALAERAGEAK